MHDVTAFPPDTKSSPLSRAAIGLYVICMALTLSMPLILVWMIYGLLWTSGPTPWHGSPAPAVLLLARVSVLEPLFVKLWWTRLLLIVAANGVFIAWLYAIHKGLRARGARLRFASHWAITGFFVPILNFVRPYQVVTDAWTGARNLQADGRSEPIPLRVKLWWVSSVMTAVVVGFGGRASLPGFIQLTAVALAAYAWGIIVPAFSIGVVALLELETRGKREGRFAPVPSPMRWRLSALSSVGSVLIAGLVTLGAYGYTAWQVRTIAETGGLAFFEQPFVTSPPPRPTPERTPEVSPADNKTLFVPDFEIPPELVMPGNAHGVPRGTPGGIMGGVPGGVLGGVIAETPSSGASTSPPTTVRLSSAVASTRLRLAPPPEYPPLAKQARIQGIVTLEVRLSEKGEVTSVRQLTGHPLLAPAAIDAVRRWRYRPYLVKGQPVEVVTTVSVTFKLAE
jgi:protein TonB